jgi:GntR family transcriptional repressor for pyruvate dehydrogenase complex
MLKPIKKTRLAEAAVEQIKDLITEKDMKPGAKLPSERELMKQLGISRASLSEGGFAPLGDCGLN